ncbi:PQQ-binding-like beta-propeller repeat protein [Massilia pinisoli]|uniref:PQQ-binding-like beta-propeller repeat protein n=1 Tax=Massilia pinisoli TaxID=1772194 RepID=A0ABT1ZRU6_9BURK|nr:PQQ-binding-like beta-propeller repeat protein [Massilia pinisoli]MCS0582645.1 PQQ-binding-like beta-propeller repeat protein [Massilia pinisoli]
MQVALLGRTAIGLACLALTACGGGGSGGSGGSSGSGGTTTPPVASVPEVKVLSGGVTRYAAQNSTVAFEVQIKPSFTPAGTLFVNATDKAGVIGTQVGVTASQDGSYVLALETVNGTPAGHYAGDITLKLCADQACATPQAVPSVTVPYDVTVLAYGSAWPGDKLTPLTPWTDVADWNTFQGNAGHTGYVPVEIKPDQLLPRWKTGAASQETVSFYGYAATLVASDGMLYASGDKALKARKEYDGTLAWSYDLSGLPYATVNPPAVASGTVYMAAGAQDSTYMFAFDAATGAVRFKAPMRSQWEHYLAPVALADAVYTNSGTYGGLFAFTNTGEQMFFANVADTSMWSPAADASNLYVYDGGLSVFDRKSGQLQLAIKDANFTNYTYQINGAPVLGAAGNVFAANYANAFLNGGSMGNELLKFNAAKGYVDWRVKGNYPLTPAYAGGVVYAPNTTPYRVEARAEADGALLWSWVPGQASETAWNGEPIVTKNLLFVSSNKATYAVDLRTHKAVWSYPMGGRLALTRSGILYIQNAEALVAFNVK